MDNPALDDPVADSLPNNVLRVLLRIQMKLNADISQRYPRVRKGEPPYTGLDDVLPQTHDEGVRLVGRELRLVFFERGLELLEGSGSDRLRN